MNKHDLPRAIDAGTRLTIRQRCGFGCVVCGAGIFEYHHFCPEYADAKEHDPQGITLLCPSCHKKAGNQIISLEQIRAADRSPKAKSLGYSRESFYLGNLNVPVRLGSSLVRAQSILMYDDEVLLGFLPPEVDKAPIRLTARLTDSTGNEMLTIVENEWRANVQRYDVNVVGKWLKIRDGIGKVVLSISLAAHRALHVDHLVMSYRGFTIEAHKQSFRVVVPSGASFRHVGENQADVGVWFKSEGQALIAATHHGAAAVGIGPAQPPVRLGGGDVNGP